MNFYKYRIFFEIYKYIDVLQRVYDDSFNIFAIGKNLRWYSSERSLKEYFEIESNNWLINSVNSLQVT